MRYLQSVYLQSKAEMLGYFFFYFLKKYIKRIARIILVITEKEIVFAFNFVRFVCVCICGCTHNLDFLIQEILIMTHLYRNGKYELELCVTGTLSETEDLHVRFFFYLITRLEIQY